MNQADSFRRWLRIKELRALHAITPGLEILELAYQRHLRVVGARAVEYWPGTGTAGIATTSSAPYEKLGRLTPQQVVAAAFESP